MPARTDTPAPAPAPITTFNQPEEPKAFHYGDPAAASKLSLGQILAILGQLLPVLSGLLSGQQKAMSAGSVQPTPADPAATPKP